jgi:hypothetical protein
MDENLIPLAQAAYHKRWTMTMYTTFPFFTAIQRLGGIDPTVLVQHRVKSGSAANATAVISKADIRAISDKIATLDPSELEFMVEKGLGDCTTFAVIVARDLCRNNGIQSVNFQFRDARKTRKDEPQRTQQLQRASEKQLS